MRRVPRGQRRAGRQQSFHRGRLIQARTPEGQFSAAVSWFQAAARDLSPAERHQVLRDAAQHLADRAVAAERRQANDSGE